MKIVHIKSEQESVVTKEQWETIVKNGFKSYFMVIADPKPTKEVLKHLDKSKDSGEKAN